MRADLDRVPSFATAAASLLVLDAIVRLLVGGPYPGATVLLLGACGLSLLPFLPTAVGTPSLRLAALPALSLGSFSILLTTVSIVGVPLTELSIRLAVAALVVTLAAAAARFCPPRGERSEPRWSAKRQGLAVAALVGVFAFSLGSSWDIVGPFPPRGTDWGHYLLYADEVAAQRGLLIDDPLAAEEDRIFADPPAVGAVYGGIRILDGVSSRSFASGVVVASALTPLSVYVTVGALWGLGAGLLAAAAYAVSPIHLEPMYWHGLATTLALVFLPLVLLALGLMYRGRRDLRTIALLGFSLAGVAVSHSTSAVVVALMIAVALVLDAVRSLVASGAGSPRQALRSWWRTGAAQPLAGGVLAAVVAGAGVVVHLRLQAADLGSPVSYRFFEPDWLTRQTIVDYYSWPFLILAAVSLALVLSGRRLRRDSALIAVAALGVASVLVGELWRIHVPFEYRRAVYYLGLALVVVIGVASLRLSRRIVWVAGYAVVLVYMAHVSIGLRLPERLLSGSAGDQSPAAGVLDRFREQLARGELPDTSLVVADRCLHFVVPYLLRRPTLTAFEEWQVGFANRLPLAEKAAAVLRGGPEGRRLAARLGVGYAVVDPRCTPNVAADLGGTVVVENEAVAVIQLPRR